MANANRPSGLAPVKHLQTGEFNGAGNVYVIPAAATTAFAIGDPVITGGSADANGVPSIALAAATGPIRGVVVAIGTQEMVIGNIANDNLIIRPAGAQATDYYALVVDDPYAVFEVQEIGTGVPLTAAAVGLNANLTLGANNGFISGWELSNVGTAVTATLQVRLLGLVRRSDNAFGQFAKWLIKINNHELAAGTVGL